MPDDLSLTTATATPVADPGGLAGIHHSAFRCRDGEQTRAFYEEVLGLPLRATLLDGGFAHLFFEMGDGRYIAFFDKPDDATPETFVQRSPFDTHIAFQAASTEALRGWRKALKARGVAVMGPIDHGFCHSIYFFDPNGLPLEITARDPRHDAILADETAKAADVLAAWTAETAARKAAAGILC